MLSAAQRAGVAALPEPLPLGRSVERIFAERISRLSPAAQHLLLVGAAEETGDLATVLRAAAVAGIGLDALEGAERAGLVSVRNGRLQFRHPLVRSAVYERATFASRQGVHRDLAAILEGTEDVDRRAWHLAAAAVEPDESVAAALENSADRARRRSGAGAAADALERSAQLTSDREERGRRLTAAAHDAWLAGQRDRAAMLLAEAEQLVEEPGATSAGHAARRTLRTAARYAGQGLPTSRRQRRGVHRTRSPHGLGDTGSGRRGGCVHRHPGSGGGGWSTGGRGSCGAVTREQADGGTAWRPSARARRRPGRRNGHAARGRGGRAEHR